ncbi:polymorphic toxin-type HINT domain-containing protein [Streptomyces sp. NBC_01288]|uniref:polymorphic toxin-type HINT domain-containing protein n=1 Tax=Streptomyces sp. NBC_01288 TaxID=2903814 RepID=UPI002E1465D2|nr:polymorphic toxin-type HINT domain-containing protein [Streptomyces sp. NBC_01288]
MTARARTCIRRRVALTVSAVLVGTLIQAAVAEPAAATDIKVPASEKPLTGHSVKPLPRVSDHQPRAPKSAPKRAWAKAGSATVTLRSQTGITAVRAGDLPISLAATPPAKGKKATARTSLTGTATVRVLDRKSTERAGVDGVLFSVRPQTGTKGDSVGVSVDYSKFAQAYGGAYAARLKLIRLPACAATHPGTAKCSTAQTIPTHNDVKAKTLTAAAVPLSAADSSGSAATTLLAATTGTSSDQGDYKATELSASSAWQTNLNTGDFSWSYDMPVPEVPGSFTPQVGLSYASGTVDGRTANTNNQASWAGDGFSLWPGFIERSYKSCADDGVKNADGTKPGDLCWAYDNATLSFNGHSGELIATGKNTFRIKGDDGTKVDRVYGADTNDVRSNNARNDEYWRVTTTDGTQYFFGYNRLPGWTSGKSETNSAWTTPVFGNDESDPCHAATFAGSWCQQGWRWNLDYAVDTHGNAIAYYYNKEGNYYARNRTAADETPYDRGGSLDHIDYGLKSASMYGAALAKVDFTSLERCLPETGVTCDASTIDDKKFYWYDTPWDLNCKSGADCYTASPSFWTRKQLSAVTTKVLQSDGTYQAIDSWALNHRWGMSDIDYQLLLESIQHTGKAATPEITLPKVAFAYDQRTNRLKTAGDDTSAFIKERLSGISDESGGQVSVQYSAAACDASSLPKPETNTTRCFPAYYTKEGDADPTLQWFNKYVVDSVTETDRTKASPEMVTRYSYLDGAAWHYDDDDGLTKEKYKTWSTWRGYAHVRVQTGGQDPVGMKSQTDHYFLRGMDGDKAAPAGGTKSVTVSDDNGGTITDHESAAGFEYKTEQYSGPGGRLLGKTVSTPWHHQTAVRLRIWGSATANLTGTASTRTWTSLDDGAGSKWRTTYQTNAFEDTAGRITQTDDFGDESISTDNQCTRTTYVDNTSAWILDGPSRVESVAVKCADTPDRSKDVVVDIRNAYDGQAYGAAPTKGDATRTATLKSHDGTTATYTEAGATYDSYGRQSSATDITGTVTATETTAPVRADRTGGLTTTTAYTPTAGFPTGSTITITPASVTGNTATAQTTTTTYDTVRGLPLTVVDTNIKRTDTTYDALGRKLKVWLPNRSKANSETPNYEFSYTITDGKPFAVGTTTLYGTGRKTSYTLYDGFLRPRQTQAPGPDGGRLISDTFYDERGLTTKAFAPYYNTSAPSTSLLTLDEALAVETQTWNAYDGLGRVTKSQQIAGNGDNGTVLSTTVTAYGGDRVTVTPPKGATPTTTITDARGNTTDLLQYHAATPTGAYDQTHYEYNPAGKLTKLTDPAGNVWKYEYDQRGNQKLAADPDKGTATSEYDDRNQLVSTTDSRGKKITHIYDGFGRETETHDGDASGTLLTMHVWDPSGFKGQLSTATRYVGGASGYAYTTTYSQYDALYRARRTTVTIPDSEGTGLKGSYQTNVGYNIDGTVASVGYPAAGSLTAEAVTPVYDDVLRPKTLSGSGGLTYVTNTVYSYTGKAMQYTYKAAGAAKTDIYNAYEWGTQRLHSSSVYRDGMAGTDKSATYGYDEAGNITSLSDVSRDGTDNQCYTYDYLGRLTDAWAQNTTTCATTPSASVLGGPAPYWQSYTYDLSGNRLTETQHDATGDTAKDVKRGYKYPAAGGKQPHILTQVDTTGPNGVSQDGYTYDSAGNTQTRTLSGDKQTLTWDAEGHLAQVSKPDGSGGTKTTSYVYDADGNRLITHTDTDTTLYLGGTQITLAKNATTPKATRYYDLGDGNQAIRTDDNKLSFLIGDHHGTSELAINATDLTLQQRRSTPFGAARGKAPTNWPGDKGFVGGTQDTSTGLTHLGARDYDPATGRFLSADPVLDAADPQQINGYSYSNNSPVTRSDPTGLESCGPSNPGCSQDNIASINKTGRYKSSNKDTNTKTTTGSKSGVKTAKDGQPLIQGIRLPTKKELVARYAILDPRHTTYSQYLARFATDLCYIRDDKNGGFCDTAERAGLLPGPQNDPWGVKATIHCITGRGDCAEAAVEDVITVATLAWGSVSRGLLARGASRTVVAEAEESATVAMLREACSFTPATPVLLKNGKTKPIGKVKPGDQVAAADPQTGKRKGARTVTARIVHRDNDLVDVTIRSADGRSATLHATSNHPFWDDTTHTWVLAGSLRPGHTLNTATNQHIQVIDVETRPGQADMYNLTVEQLHTYYVVAGTAPILVHNSTCSVTMSSAIGDDSLLTKAAQQAGKNQAVQRDLDNLFSQLANGNMNPGIGSKALAGTDVTYARGANGGRLFFRNADGGVQIVGKSDKGNESKVIGRLMQLYGQ